MTLNFEKLLYRLEVFWRLHPGLYRPRAKHVRAATAILLLDLAGRTPHIKRVNELLVAGGLDSLTMPQFDAAIRATNNCHPAFDPTSGFYDPEDVDKARAAHYERERGKGPLAGLPKAHEVGLPGCTIA